MKNRQWKRVVLKVGSSLIAPDRKGCSSRYLLHIAKFILQCRDLEIQVILVSSGSVAAGAHFFGNIEKPTVAIKKAMAAAGQNEMMASWNRFFDFPSAQILLTHGDLQDKERYDSIRETIFALLEHGILPVINENDTVTTDALKVGDNDNLSAMVAAAADADALIICSDVDGLYDKNPHTCKDATMIKEVCNIDEAIYAMAGGAMEDGVGTGGMQTKIEAAEKATSHGIRTYIVNGFKESSFELLMNGTNPGTVFTAYDLPMQENLHWMTHTSKAQGELVIESNFDHPIDEHSEQFTSDEIVEVRGNFSEGDIILVSTEDGKHFAKAKANYSSSLLNFITTQEGDEDSNEFRHQTGPIISDENIAVLEQEEQWETDT
ncbi:glutamate 5-kinase [Psychromonas antarctica]|jgi:glutamate 5-kinase|uniref:glutamate 5-kinase n=1 Tax=Psychromonas antarctica TaxID=67573 RepID=UPI001EE970C7|nr:glutamate 5-kinase [Psychromonas antarctica]MCG6200829.1 glutamate 5-kinase [Psychromonas antarctica]